MTSPTEAELAAPSTPRPSLLSIVEAMQVILQRVDESDGEMDDATAAEFDALGLTLDEKAEAIAAVCRMEEEAAEACDRMARPYTDRAKRKRNRVEDLKRRLQDAMDVAGKKKIERPTATIAVQRNGQPSVELTVPDHELEKHAPEDLFESKKVFRKDLLKARLVAGEKFSFAVLRHGSHLRIR